MTRSKKKSGLTSEEICRIIETSSKSQVRVLKFDGLHLEFTNPEPATKVPAEVAPLPANEIAAIQTEENKKALLQEELRLKQQYLDDLIIQDPLELERMIANGDVEEESDDGYDGEDD